MANPLKTAGPGPVRGVADLLAWCDEQNQQRIFHKLERWFYVTENEGAEMVSTLQGCDATNLRKQLAGKLDDFAGWPAVRMNGYRRWLMDCARRGTLESYAPARQPEAA